MLERLFPGVDPYIEARGFAGDFQIPFLVYCKEMLYDWLPDEYSVFIHHRDMPKDPSYIEPIPDRFLAIERRTDDAFVTIIELLDPGNRDPERRKSYLTWRNRQQSEQVNFVNIDLFRSGDLASASIPSAEYGVFITRANSSQFTDVITWTVRDPLPAIPIPLVGDDRESMLDLNELYRRVYEKGHERSYTKYDAAPPNFLSPEDQEWASGIMAKLT